MNRVIRHSTCNTAAIISLIIAICFVLGVLIAMAYNLPIRSSFEWILFPVLLVGGMVICGGFLLGILNPKESSIDISSHAISIFDAPRFRWINRNLEPNNISRFVYRIDDRRCWFETVDRQSHHLSDHLAINHEKIAQALQDLHPSIEYDSR